MAAGCGAGAAVDPLDGRDFLSTSVTTDGEPFALVDGTRVRLSFADGRLTASAGCNTIGYTYQLDGDTLVVEGGAMTEMGCDPALHDQDEWLSEFLGSRPTVAANGNDLVLTSGGTVMDLLDTEVAEPDLELQGTLWTVDSIISGDAVSSIPAGATATLRFAADGTVAVDAGCNSGSGTYEADDDTVRITDLAVTEMACDGDAGALEAAVLLVLGADELGYTIDASRLTLMAGDNGLSLIGD